MSPICFGSYLGVLGKCTHDNERRREEEGVGRTTFHSDYVNAIGISFNHPQIK